MPKNDFLEVYNKINPLLASIGNPRAKRGSRWTIEQIHNLFQDKSATHKKIRSIILEYMPKKDLQKHFKSNNNYTDIIYLLSDVFMDANGKQTDNNYINTMKKAGIKPQRWSEIRRDCEFDKGYRLYLHELLPIFNVLYNHYKGLKQAKMYSWLQRVVFDYLFVWYELLNF
jgi:hypothetical protein